MKGRGAIHLFTYATTTSSHRQKSECLSNVNVIVFGTVTLEAGYLFS